MSEQDVLKIRDNLADRRLTVEELAKIPLDIGLMNEEGFPHHGFLNYVSPEIDANTGTILVRGLFDNPKPTCCRASSPASRCRWSSPPRRCC